MTNEEDKFFDELEEHLKLLGKDPTPINKESSRFIFSLLALTEGLCQKVK